MKTTSRRVFAALLGLCVLSVMVRGARGDETADSMAEMRRQNDEFNRQAYEEREARDKFLREAQEERDARDKFNREAYEERAAMDKFNRETQAERDAWYKWNREVQEWRDNQQKQQEWDDWLNRLGGSAQSVEPAAGLKSTPPKAPVARPVPAPQLWFQAHAVPQQGLVILNPYMFQQMARQNQERVRQQIMQTRQQIMQGRQGFPQLIQNPFVRSSP